MQGSKKYRAKQQRPYARRPKPWSKLQREIYKLLLPELKLQIHCRVYRMDSQRGHTDLPRYWISLDKEIIWDYPKNFEKGHLWEDTEYYVQYPYVEDASDISALLREYIDTPKELLCAKEFAADRWGLAEILKAADRRLGREALHAMLDETENSAARKVLNKREMLHADPLH